MSSRERMTKVLGFLVLSVTAGAIVLRLLQPAPLINVTAFSLAAAFNPIQQIYQTRVPVDGSKWSYIEIHQSRSAKGNAQLLAQAYRQQGFEGLTYHFIINNGNGSPDGRIQVSQCWTEQTDHLGRSLNTQQLSSPAIIRICLIGDFADTSPAPIQLSQLKALLGSLQQRCQISPANISLASSASAGYGQWRKFPLDDLRQTLLSNTQ